MPVCPATIPKPDAVIDYKVWLPLISPFVVILLFILDRWIGFSLRRKEIERNWYLKVLLEPRIEELNTFFEETHELFEFSYSELSNMRNAPHAEFLSRKAQEIGKFQVKKRKVENQILAPITARFPQTGNDASSILRNLEDYFTASLDGDFTAAIDFSTFQLEVTTYRTTLLETLYAPLKPKNIFS